MEASASPSRRSMRTQKEWKVETSGEEVSVGVFEQSRDARAHFRRGFIGERDGQNGGRGHMFRGDQMGDAMRDDLGFTAARAREDQDRSIGGSDGFALLGIETREKIH